MADEIIVRRRALKYLGLLAATAAGRDFLAAWLPGAASGAQPGTPGVDGQEHHASGAGDRIANLADNYTPKFFKPAQFKTVEALTELIIPNDDGPGAKEAQVARYIDFVVFSAAENMPELQRDWTAGLDLLERLSKEKLQKPFLEFSSAEREQLLMDISLPERDHAKEHAAFPFYRRVKEMTVEGFYTSRIGLIDVLGYKGRDYLAEFVGCTHPEHQ